MRELKFRAWDTVTKKYFFPWPDGVVMFGETTCFDLMGQQLHEQGRDTILGLNDLVIEQFTGLKDKNGGEIYEGDILDAGWFNENVVVQFKQVNGRWEAHNDGPHTLPAHKFSMSTIIGNIHENPELLA